MTWSRGHRLALRPTAYETLHRRAWALSLVMRVPAQYQASIQLKCGASRTCMPLPPRLRAAPLGRLSPSERPRS